MQPGDKVRLKANPGRVGVLGNETDGPAHRLRVLVNFLDGDEQFVLAGSLEKVEKAASGPYELMVAGRYGRSSDLRGAITFYRLSGKLTNLIYSLNTALLHECPGDGLVVLPPLQTQRICRMPNKHNAKRRHHIPKMKYSARR